MKRKRKKIRIKIPYLGFHHDGCRYLFDPGLQFGFDNMNKICGLDKQTCDGTTENCRFPERRDTMDKYKKVIGYKL